MDARGTRQLCQTADRILDFARSNHHEVGELINDNDDLRLLAKRVSVLVKKRFVARMDLLVVSFKVTHAELSEQIVAMRHLLHCPVQSAACLSGVGDNRNHKVRDSVVNTQFHNLRVNHDDAQILRLVLVQEADDHRVDADGFAGAGGASDQKVRHLRNVGNDDPSGDILTYGKGNLALVALELLRLDERAEQYSGAFRVRNLDAYRGFAGDRRFDSDVGSGQVQFDIIFQIGDTADLDALLGSELVAGNARAAADVGNLNVDTEALQRAFEFCGGRLEHILCHALGLAGGTLQKIDRREPVYLWRLDDRYRRNLFRPVLCSLVLRACACVLRGSGPFNCVVCACVSELCLADTSSKQLFSGRCNSLVRLYGIIRVDAVLVTCVFTVVV